MDKYFNIHAEGCSIRCKLYTDDPAGVRTVILFGHGFGGHKDNRAAEKFARRALEKNKGLAVVTFNWPCHGDDVRKTLRLEDCSRYLRLVVSHIQTRFDSPRLCAYATSFGGYLFLKYMSEVENPFDKTALRCPAVNMYDVLTAAIMSEEEWDRIRKGKSVLVGFDRKIEIDGAFLRSLKQADITRRDFLSLADDILILQGTRDEIVPPDAVRAFAEENVIDFEPIEGADHRFQKPGTIEQAHARILAFFGLK